jgi:hypothetical protein
MSVANFHELKEHVGHKIVCVAYSENGGWQGDKYLNVAIECETCNEVLLDYDNESKEEREAK